MFNSVKFVRDLCFEKKIPISKLEKDLGYGNGYFNAKKQSKIPYERALEIAEYLSVSAELILTGNEKAPADGERNKNAPDELILTEGEIRILSAFRGMSPERQKALAELLGISDDQK